MTAQEEFACMMRREVAPALRLVGLKGSGFSFSILSDDYWAVIGFQKNRHSDRDAVSFTINLNVVSRPAWDAIRAGSPWRTERPSPNESLWGLPGAWSTRIGLLLPGQDDYWWELRRGDPTDRLASEVVAAVRDYALPAMRAQMI
jgi:hypothetical protein